MMPNFNFHTHSHFCDGSDHPEQYIKEALRSGFHTLGFSSHAPVPFSNGFAIQSNEKLVEYCKTIRNLGAKYSCDINVYLGLEIDYIPGLMPDFEVFTESCMLDYTIGSVHLVRNGKKPALWFIDGPKRETFDQGLAETFGGDARKAVTAYYEQIMMMVDEQHPDVVGHIDKIKMHNKGKYFSEEDGWYKDLVVETLKTIREKGGIVELNTRGVYKRRSETMFPSDWILHKIAHMGIPVTISSDAHKPGEISGCFEDAVDSMKRCGIREVMVLRGNGWQSQSLEDHQGR